MEKSPFGCLRREAYAVQRQIIIRWINLIIFAIMIKLSVDFSGRTLYTLIKSNHAAMIKLNFKMRELDERLRL